MCARSQPAIECTSANCTSNGSDRRNAVGIDLVRRETFGLEEDLMARPLREAHDLVLDRGTVARSDALDDSGEKRRPIETAANDLVRALVGVRDPARELRRMHFARAEKAHDRRGIVAGLSFEAPEIDRAPVEPWRRSGLEPTHGQREFAQPRAKCFRRRIAGAPRLVMLEADVDQTRQERAGGQHHGVCLERHAHLRQYAVTSAPAPVSAMKRSSTACWNKVRLGSFSSRRRIAAR